MSEKIALERPVLGGEVNFPVCLAPMVGLSHVALRALVREYLPEGAVTIWPTEMLNSRRLPHENLGQTDETRRAEGEDFLVPQILGNDAEDIRRSLERLEKWGIRGVDINMGCPVKKALKHNYGVALMGDAGYAADVVRMTVASTSRPVSVKLRAGLQKDFSFLLNFARGLEAAGASWITLHPRTAEQKRRGSADWDQIRQLREALAIPVIGNGDVQVSNDVCDLLEQTRCDMVMVGRALTARPWLLWQLGEMWGWPAPVGRERDRAPVGPDQEGVEFGRSQLSFLKHLRQHFQESVGLRRFRFFVTNSHPWLEFGHSYFKATQKANTYDAMERVVIDFFSTPKRMMSRTNLRY
jgi:tRNA-dihydrouridine synthase B